MAKKAHNFGAQNLGHLKDLFFTTSPWPLFISLFLSTPNHLRLIHSNFVHASNIHEVLSLKTIPKYLPMKLGLKNSEF